MRYISCVLIIMILLTGCASDSGKNGPTTITLTPVDMFSGNAAKLKPFLGTMSGAFKLRYEGKRPNASLDIDLWKDGKKAASSGSIGDLFFSPNEEDNEMEVMISMDTDYYASEGQEKMIKVKVATGSSLMTFTIPWDKKHTALGLLSEHELRTFHKDDAVPVWGMQATSTNTIQTADLSPESLRRLEAAILFTLRIEDQ
ncbi:hypothetical protein [Paenibacillus terrigena]|uniref:hypothetical protein n=1 Tax=Paenibacillus terrigena TaxID=369333 RepID=UPI0028D336AC|nr:hypothetical protein [Paenibacillus terrigena]